MSAVIAESILWTDVVHKGEENVSHFSLTCLDESKAETSPCKEPVEQLEAELAELRMLTVDESKYEGMQEGRL